MNPSDPAFPGNYYVKDAAGLNCTHFPGMTKRELFAAMAMQGLCAAPAEAVMFEELAHDAVLQADALIAELSKEPKP